jgi:hypothetical protein
VAVAVGAVLSVFVIAGAIADSTKDNVGSGSTATNGSSSSSEVPEPATPQTVLSLDGNGDSQTQEFTVADEWSIQYSFDCSTFGYPGNFAVDVEGSDGVPSLTNRGPNALASSGSSVVYNHHGGTYYLSILSECDWHITVVSGG